MVGWLGCNYFCTFTVSRGYNSNIEEEKRPFSTHVKWVKSRSLVLVFTFFTNVTWPPEESRSNPDGESSPAAVSACVVSSWGKNSPKQMFPYDCNHWHPVTWINVCTHRERNWIQPELARPHFCFLVCLPLTEQRDPHAALCRAWPDWHAVLMVLSSNQDHHDAC